MILKNLKPEGYFSPVAVCAEYRGRRYLLTNCTNWHTAEIIATDYAKSYDNTLLFTSDRYDSTHIDGNANDLRKALNNE